MHLPFRETRQANRVCVGKYGNSSNNPDILLLSIHSKKRGRHSESTEKSKTHDTALWVWAKLAHCPTVDGPHHCPIKLGLT